MSDIQILIDNSAVMGALDNLKTADIYSALSNGAMLIERDAKLNCPVKTGNLRASIQTEMHETDDEYIAEVGTNVEYAPYVEFGTKKMDAQPFLIPAFESNRESISESLMNALKGGK